MKTENSISNKESSMSNKERALLLVSGSILAYLSSYGSSVELFAWVAIAPFMVFILKSKGWKDSFLLFVVLQLAINITTFKIITEPIPPFFALMFGIPGAISIWIQLSLWNFLRKKIDRVMWIPLWVSMAVISDWMSFEYSSLGMWGTAAGSQVNNLPILQLASVGGISLISGLMAAVSAIVALMIFEKRKVWNYSACVIATVVAVALVFGSYRVFTVQSGDTVKAAAIVTDLHLDASGKIPSDELIARETDTLFDRSLQAVRSGAKLVVWNEGATLIDTSDEASFLERAQVFSEHHNVDLVVAYIVPLSTEPFRYDNKYVWMSSEGESLEVYRKHHPVPGEPCIAGTEELIVHDRPWGKATGAICYDYDFPSMAREQGKKGAGISVVPSSDWAGIDPFHTRMARIRGIEGGFSVLRPVRWASSEGFDAYGRLRGSLPYHEGNRVLVVDLPTEHVNTLYSRLGDWPVAVAIIMLIVIFVRSLINNKRSK